MNNEPTPAKVRLTEGLGPNAPAEMRDPHRGGSSYEASMLRNLLARIHRDGGHYVEQHGLDKALDDADAQVVRWLALVDERDVAKLLADSEGTRAVNYLRRARKAEKLLREVLNALPGLQAPNCLGTDLYRRVSAALGANVAGNRIDPACRGNSG